MTDVSGVDNITSSTDGADSLTGIKSAVDNLNSAKAEISGQVFTGNISAPNLAGTNTGDQTLPTDATLATSDVTTNNASSSKHGFAPKSPGDATKFLNGAATPAFANPKDSDLAVTDVTTNNVSTSAHGFAPKAPNDATKYLDGTGVYSVPTAFVFKNGHASYDTSTASGNQTIAHGLGKIPKFIRIFATWASGTTFLAAFSDGTYNGTTMANSNMGIPGGSVLVAASDTTFIVNLYQGSSINSQATVTFDATNITLAWTKTGSATGQAQLMWEAIG